MLPLKAEGQISHQASLLQKDWQIHQVIVDVQTQRSSHRWDYLYIKKEGQIAFSQGLWQIQTEENKMGKLFSVLQLQQPSRLAVSK